MDQGVEVAIERIAPWPIWVTAGLLFAAIGLATMAYLLEHGGYRWAQVLRRLVLAGLRLSLVVIVVWMLYQWTRRPYQTERADLLLLVDVSASMAHADAYEDAQLRAALEAKIKAQALESLSRVDHAKALLLVDRGRTLRRLEDRYNVKVYFLGESTRPASDGKATLAEAIREAHAADPASRLGQGLRDCLDAQRGRPTAAAVLFTDGVVTSGPSLVDAAAYARGKNIPLVLVGLGESRSIRDLWIGDLLADDMVFVNDLATFEFRLGATGFAGTPATVRLRRADTGLVVDEVGVICPADGQTASAILRHRPSEIGEFDYVVEVDSPPREARRDNNTRQRRVQVREETIRVLYVQEYPSGDFRFLKNLLSRERKSADGRASSLEVEARAIQLTSILQEADERFAAIDETAASVFPISKEALFEYDVVLFGDVNPARLGAAEMQNLVEFVSDRGGGMAFIAGPRHTPLAFRETPLAALFPFDVETAAAPAPTTPLTESFVPRRTRLGETSSALALADSDAQTRRIWSELPGFYWLLEAPDLKPGVRVLLEHPTRKGPAGVALPVLTLQYVGAGKVMFLASDDSWRWRYRAGDQHFARFWLQMIRELARARLLGGPVELTSDRTEYAQGEPVSLRARFRDDRQAPLADDGVMAILERQGAGERQDPSAATAVALTRRGESRGEFVAEVLDLPPGDYRARLGAPAMDGEPVTASFTVAALPGELAQVAMNANELKEAARISGGTFYSAANAERWSSGLPRGQPVRVQPLPPDHLWNSPLVAGLFVALLITEWVLRRRAGLR